MGFWHSWQFASPLSDHVWDACEQNVQRLMDALPGAVAESRNARKQFSILSAALSFLQPKDPTPARGGFENGRLFGRSESGDRTMLILPDRNDRMDAFQIEVANKIEVQCAKTGAQPYDRLLIGALCSIETHAPGSVTIQQTDGDPAYWIFCSAWASKVLERTMTLPSGFMREGEEEEAGPSEPKDPATDPAGQAASSKRTTPRP